jgi:hypothetical protein
MSRMRSDAKNSGSWGIFVSGRGKIIVVSTCRRPTKVPGEYPVWLKFPLFAIGLRGRIALFRVALGMYDV